MSYTKPIKQCVDAAVGIGEVNGMIGSQTETRAALSVEHEAIAEQLQASGAWGDIGGSGINVVDAKPVGGAHNTPKVARGTMNVVPVLTASQIVGASALRVGSKSGVCTGLTRIATGSYFIGVQGLIDFYAVVTPAADDTSAARMFQQTPVNDGSSAPGVYVSLWEDTPIDDGAVVNSGFVLTDFAFDVVVYGERPDSQAAAYVAPPIPRRPSLDPRNHMRPFKFLKRRRR